eukprot:5413784-Pyramimonas_sp.AAC.1
MNNVPTSSRTPASCRDHLVGVLQPCLLHAEHIGDHTQTARLSAVVHEPLHDRLRGAPRVRVHAEDGERLGLSLGLLLRLWGPVD